MEVGTSWVYPLMRLIMWIPWSTALFTEDNIIKDINVSYTSQHMGNCWYKFNYHNTCDHIHLSINDRTILDDNGHVPPIMNFTESEGFKVEGCQTVLMRCHKDGVETHYKIQVKKESEDGNNQTLWAFVGVLVPLFLVCPLLGCAVYYRKVYRRDKHHLPFCCESQVEDPAVEWNPCESQETLQSEH